MLKENGFNILSLANNHIIDCKEKGITRTIKVLRKNNLSFVGVNEGDASQEPLIVRKKGIKIGFLAYCKDRPYLRDLKIGPYLIRKSIIEDVRKAKEKTDFLVVSLHWGREYKTKPTLKQEKLAKALIDNGADAVVGHHPHVVQRIRKYKDRIIAYSLGNFVFDQRFNEKVKNGVLLKLILSGKKIKRYEIIHTCINDKFEPELNRKI